jgi:hypothetical protein
MAMNGSKDEGFGCYINAWVKKKDAYRDGMNMGTNLGIGMTTSTPLGTSTTSGSGSSAVLDPNNSESLCKGSKRCRDRRVEAYNQ